MKLLQIRYILFLTLVCGFLLQTSCARKGRPSGGPKDITPPVMLKASPDTFSTNVSPNLKKIEIDFDEYVVLKDHMKNVLISPPLERPPAFSPAGTAAPAKTDSGQ